MLHLLKIKNYRIFLLGIVFNDFALMISPMIIGWIMLSISGSAFWVGAAAGLGGVGMAFTSPFSGAFIDRFNKKTVMLFALYAQLVITLIMGFIIYIDLLEIWHLLIFTLTNGCFSSLRITSKLAIPYDLVGEGFLLKSSATNFLSITLMAIIAPLYGGWLLAVPDVGFAYSIWSVSVTLFVSGLIISRLNGISNPENEVGIGFLSDLIDGFRELFSNKKIRILLFCVVASETFGWSAEAMFPIIAKNELGLDSKGYGYLIAGGAIGASVTSFTIAIIPEIKNKSAMVIVGLIGFGSFLFLFALSNNFWLSFSFLGLAFVFSMFYETAINTLLQTTAPPRMRGRVLSFQTFGWGFSGMAGFISGSVALFLGAPIAVASGGLIVSLQGIRSSRSLMSLSKKNL